MVLFTKKVVLIIKPTTINKFYIKSLKYTVERELIF